MLEKTRQRREQLHQKLASTPNAQRKRKPLQVDTSENMAATPIVNGECVFSVCYSQSVSVLIAPLSPQLNLRLNPPTPVCICAHRAIITTTKPPSKPTNPVAEICIPNSFLIGY